MSRRHRRSLETDRAVTLRELSRQVHVNEGVAVGRTGEGDLELPPLLDVTGAAGWPAASIGRLARRPYKKVVIRHRPRAATRSSPTSRGSPRRSRGPPARRSAAAPQAGTRGITRPSKPRLPRVPPWHPGWSDRQGASRRTAERTAAGCRLTSCRRTPAGKSVDSRQ